MMYAIAFGSIAILALGGCGDPRSVAPTAPGGVGAHLITLGDWFLWIGAASLGLAVASRIVLGIASLAGGPLGAIAGFIPSGILFSTGVTGIAIGSSFIWLGNNPWMLGLAIGIAVVAFGWHHRDDIRRWLGLGPAPQPKAT